MAAHVVGPWRWWDDAYLDGGCGCDGDNAMTTVEPINGSWTTSCAHYLGLIWGAKD